MVPPAGSRDQSEQAKREEFFRNVAPASGEARGRAANLVLRDFHSPNIIWLDDWSPESCTSA